MYNPLAIIMQEVIFDPLQWQEITDITIPKVLIRLEQVLPHHFLLLLLVKAHLQCSQAHHK